MDQAIKEEYNEEEEEDFEGPKQTKGDYVLAIYGFPKQDACQVKALLKPFLTCTYRMRPRLRDDVAIYLHFKEYKEMMSSKKKLHNKYVKNCRLTVEFEGDPPLAPKPEDKPKPAPGVLMKAPPTIKQMKVCSTMEFMDASYNLQVALKTQNAHAELQQIDNLLEKHCDHLTNTLKEMKLRHGGMVCEVDRVVECEPSIQTAHKFMFLRRKAQGTGVINVGMHYKSSAIRSATLVQRHLPPQVVELTQVLEQMVLPCEKCMTTFMYKVYVYTNKSRHIMLVLESNASPIHAFASQIKDFFARGPGKKCSVRSLRVMDSQTFIGGQNVVMGSPFIIEHIAGFLVQLTPSSQMWTDFHAAEKLCNVVTSLLAANPSSVILEIGTSSAVVGLHLAKRVKKLVSIDKNPLVDLAQMNSQMNGANITYIGGDLDVIFRQAVNLLVSYDYVSAILTFTRYDVPDAGFMVKLRHFKQLRRLVIVAEANTADKVIVMLSEKCEGTEPFLPIRLVPVDTMPNTKRYVVAVLLLRVLDINAKLKSKNTPVFEEPSLQALEEAQSRQKVKEEKDRLRALDEERKRVAEEQRLRKLQQEEEGRRRLAEEQMRVKIKQEEERRSLCEEEERLRVLKEEQERRRQIEEEERERELEEERERVAEEERRKVLERHKNKLRMVRQFQEARINILDQERRIFKEEVVPGHTEGSLEQDTVNEEYEIMRTTFRRETQVNDLRRKIEERRELAEARELGMQREQKRVIDVDDEDDDRRIKRRRSQDRDRYRRPSEERERRSISEDRDRSRRRGSEERERRRDSEDRDRSRRRGSEERERRRDSEDRDRSRRRTPEVRDRNRRRTSEEQDRNRRRFEERDRKRRIILEERERIRRVLEERDRNRRVSEERDRNRRRGSEERDRNRRRGSEERDINRRRGSEERDRRRLDDRRGRLDDDDRLRRDRRDDRLDIRDQDRRRVYNDRDRSVDDDRPKRRRYEDERDESGPSQRDPNVADDTIKTLAQVITEALWKVTKAVKESGTSSDNLFVRRDDDSRQRQLSPPSPPPPPPRRYDSDFYGRP